jgi:hypothetical protein
MGQRKRRLEARVEGIHKKALGTLKKLTCSPDAPNATADKSRLSSDHSFATPEHENTTQYGQ